MINGTINKLIKPSAWKDVFKIKTKKSPNNLLRFFISSGMAAIAGSQLYTYLLWNPEELARHGLLTDDAYFYSVLARNFQEYHILTFDGGMTTNGVQPLWMLVQTLFRMLLPDTDGVVLLALSSWVCYVIFVFLVIWYINRNPSIANFLSTVTVGGLILLQPYFQYTVMAGLETPLMLLILILTLIICDRISEKTKADINNPIIWEICLLAFLTSLLFLARTDLFWAPIIVFLWRLRIEKRVTVILIIFASIVSLLIVPYLAFNYFTEQSLMPISGRVKLFYLDTFFPDLISYLNSDEWHGSFHIFDSVLGLIFLPVTKIIRYLLIFLMFFVVSLIVWRNRLSIFFPQSIKIFGAIIFLHLIYMHFFYRELRPYTAYYFTPEILFVVLVIAFGVRKLFLLSISDVRPPSKDVRFYSFFKYMYMLIIAFSIYLFTSAWIRHDLHPVLPWIERLKLAEDISRLVPVNEKVAAFWPGLFAQFSKRQVVSLDGIIGSNEYFQRYIKTGREIDYMLEENIKYLAIYFDRNFDDLISGGKPKIEIWSMLGMQRLWENQDFIIQVHSTRLLNSEGAGWYLLEIGPKSNIK